MSLECHMVGLCIGLCVCESFRLVLCYVAYVLVVWCRFSLECQMEGLGWKCERCNWKVLGELSLSQFGPCGVVLCFVFCECFGFAVVVLCGPVVLECLMAVLRLGLGVSKLCFKIVCPPDPL